MHSDQVDGTEPSSGLQVVWFNNNVVISVAESASELNFNELHEYKENQKCNFLNMNLLNCSKVA